MSELKRKLSTDLRPPESETCHGRARPSILGSSRPANSVLRLVLAGFFSSWATLTGADDRLTQELALSPGWNAVYLEVQPEPSDPATVFDGLPVESVWTWSGRDSPVQFLVDPAEIEWNSAGWLSYRTVPGEEMLTNLYAINANRTYLIKLGGNTPRTLQVSGPPSTSPLRWTPDAFNLVGFHLDPASSISLGAFLAASPAHSGQAIYRFDQATGTWHFVHDPFATSASPGQAYWVYCEGASRYQGPWFLDLRRGAGLDFGVSLSERLIHIVNVSESERTIRVSELSSPNSVGLFFRRFNAELAAFDWQPLSTMPEVVVPAGGRTPLSLAIRRENLSADSVASILELKDDAGIRFLVPVRAKR